MAIENGDFVRLNFTGKIKETDEIFDTKYLTLLLKMLQTKQAFWLKTKPMAQSLSL